MTEHIFNEENRTTEQNSTVDGHEAYVEDYRIRPREIEPGERVVMSVLMRISGDRGTFYVDANVIFGDGDDAGHRIVVRERGSGHVEEIEGGWTTAEPVGMVEASQAVHECYVGSVDDWYEFAVNAAE